MMFKDIIYLLSESTSTENDLGDDITPEVEIKRFANKKSVRQSEFYQAHQTGIKPVVMFEIKEAGYSDQEFLKYNSVRYKITRTYTTKNECIELVCEKVDLNATS